MMHQTATNLLGHSTCHHTQVFDRTHIHCLLLPRHGSPLPDLPGQHQFSPKVLKCTVSFLHRVIDYVYVAKCLCVCELPDLLRIFPVAWANIRVAFWPAHNWKRVTWSHHNRLTPQTCNVHTTKTCYQLEILQHATILLTARQAVHASSRKESCKSLVSHTSNSLNSKASHRWSYLSAKHCKNRLRNKRAHLHTVPSDSPVHKQLSPEEWFARCYQPSTRHQQMFGP